MLDAAVQALSQMFSPPFRTVLLKSIGLAIALIIIIGIGLDRLLVWLLAAAWGRPRTRRALRPCAAGSSRLGARDRDGLRHRPRRIFLMPAVTALVASFFVDEIADEVERSTSC